MFTNYTTNLNNCKDEKSSVLTNFDHLAIGFSAMFGSVTKIMKVFGISRSYVYKLKEYAEKLITLSHDPAISPQELCHKIMPDVNLCVINDSFIKRTVLVLALDACASEEGIKRSVKNIFGINISIGSIYNILTNASNEAFEFDSKIDLSGIKQGANDEIFQGDMPIFTGVDTVTSYAYLLEPNDNRSADTWQKAMTKCKSKGLDLDVSISDCGTGLLSGIPKAFPNARTQPDLFHWLMELGKIISSYERSVYGLMNQYYSCKEASESNRPHRKTISKLSGLKLRLDLEIDRYDRLYTLYSWLKELTHYQGIRYEDTLALCQWILAEMEAAEGISNKLKRALAKTEKHLPDVLQYLKRAEKALKYNAVKNGYPEDTFLLMYRLQSYQADSIEYKSISKRLKRILKDRYDELFNEMRDILDGVKRASSLVENLNGRLRRYINAKRRVSEKFFTLLKVYFNTRKFRRSRRAERKGKSPLELLTGKPHPDFYDIVCG